MAFGHDPDGLEYRLLRRRPIQTSRPLRANRCFTRVIGQTPGRSVNRPGSVKKDAPIFDVALYEPEIPPNTGNIIRLCANTGARLHLIRPLGFRLDDRSLRRAGLDYDALTAVRLHADFAACLAALRPARWLAISTRGRSPLRHRRVRAGRSARVRLRDARSAGRRARTAVRPTCGCACRCARGAAASIWRTPPPSCCTRPGASTDFAGAVSPAPP